MGCCGGCGGEDHQAKNENEQETKEQATEQKEADSEA